MSEVKKKKGLSSINYLQLLFDLIIVFIGVYAAFTFSSMKEDRKKQEDGQRVVELLDVGMVRYEALFNGFSQYHAGFNSEFKAKLDKGEIPEHWDYYYPYPQYPVDVINYVLTNESYQLFNLDFYLPLTGFANEVQKLMNIEQKIVETSEKYEPLPPKAHQDYQIIFNKQRVNALRFYEYLEMRRNTSARLSNQAKNIRSLISKMGKD